MGTGSATWAGLLNASINTRGLRAENALSPPKPRAAKKTAAGKKPAAPRAGRSSSRDQVALLVHQTEGLSIDEDVDSDDSVVVLPPKKSKASAAAGDGSGTSHAAEGKKKKRYAAVLTRYIDVLNPR